MASRSDRQAPEVPGRPGTGVAGPTAGTIAAKVGAIGQLRMGKTG